MKNNIEIIIPENNRMTRLYTTPNGIHTHKLWELVIFIEGTSINIVNNNKFIVSTGDIFLLSPFQTHSIEFITQKHLHRDIYFTHETVLKILDTYPVFFKNNIIEKNTIVHLKTSLCSYESILNEAEKLDRLLIAQEISKSKDLMDICNSLSLSILSYFLGMYLEHDFDRHDNGPKVLYEIIQKLQDPEVFTKKVSEIIKMSNYSYTQFAKIFKENKKISIGKYIIDLKINYAVELMTETNDSILDISLKCGYDSFSSFSKQFKKKYGETPLQYRKKHSRILI